MLFRSFKILINTNLLQNARGFFILIFMKKASINTEKKRELWSCLGLLMMAVIWGFAFVVVKSSLDFVPPLYMLAFRFSLGGVVLALIFFKRLRRTNKKEILHGILIGACLFIAEVFQTYGCMYTTAGKNAFLTTIYIVLTPILYWAFYKEFPRTKVFIAAIISFVGIGLISLSGRFTIQLGDILTLACGLFFALQIVFIARYAKDDDPINLSIHQLLFSAVASWAVAPVVVGPVTPTMVGSEAVVGILYLGLLSTMLCFLLQNICQKYAPPGPAAIIMGMESVFGALFSLIFLHEVMSARTVVGCVLMFIAILLCELDIPVLSMFFPDEIIESAYEIDYEDLYRQGYRGIIFDIDNTLVTHGAPANEAAKKLLGRLDEIGFSVLFLSNNKEYRVKSFRDEGMPNGHYLYKAGKPKKSGYYEAMHVMGTDLKSTICIGDQIFTDIWGAKRIGMRNILTRPIHPKEEIQIVIKRRLEKVVLVAYYKYCKDHELTFGKEKK